MKFYVGLHTSQFLSQAYKINVNPALFLSCIQRRTQALKASEKLKSQPIGPIRNSCGSLNIGEQEFIRARLFVSLNLCQNNLIHE